MIVILFIIILYNLNYDTTMLSIRSGLSHCRFSNCLLGLSQYVAVLLVERKSS